MPLSSEAQSLFDHAKAAIPRWLTSAGSAALEWLFGFTEIMDEVRGQGQDWLDITLLENATGVELDQHASDRGTSRRAGESDAALRERLRNITDQLTEPALKAGVDAILEGNFLAHFQVGLYTDSGWTTVLEEVGVDDPTSLTLTMVDDGTNPPTLEEDGNATTIHFDSGVTTRLDVENLITLESSFFGVLTSSDTPLAAMQAGDVFEDRHFYLSGVVCLRRDRGHCQTDGACTAFASRGYRMANHQRPMAYIFILPFGTDEATVNAVIEYLRQNGPAGYIYYVERQV